MKKIKFLLFLLLPAVTGLFSCQEETASKLEPGDPSKVSTGVVTGSVIDNLGTSAIISLTVGSDGGGVILDNGIIANKVSDFTVSTAGTIIGAASTAATGQSQATIAGLSKSTLYYYRAYSYNSNGIAYGEIKSFETSNVTFTPYRTQFRPNVPADIADWVFDKYDGFDASGEDLVWFNTDLGTTAVSSYWDGEDITLISPCIRIANQLDTCSFGAYFCGYGSPQTTLKIYITEDLGNYGEPVRNMTYGGAQGTVKIGMSAYLGKSVYIVFVIEEGDFILYNFAIAPPA